MSPFLIETDVRLTVTTVDQTIEALARLLRLGT
jgi:hypothetical protein